MTSTLHAEIVISDVVGSTDCNGSFHLLVNGNAGPFTIEVESGGVHYPLEDVMSNGNFPFYLISQPKITKYRFLKT